LGARNFPRDERGAVKNLPRHPILEDDVVVYAGATILGRISIGRGSIIGGNVWITRSLPQNSSVTQAQPRDESFDRGSGI
jgi:serine O-acetyltransferase